ncbi:putative type I polyketide synthase loading module [Mycobacterium ulcerans str. Harvey]|uniref:Type I polyketide synthase loading module n=1 Tax=Mycobacterium ulcerans str. Harvey TaxID=1299332 RepID=A0ABP3A127_MYCUL|nr:putative type I polyketide synthase loading module [Mycobacterium ulcerans str. Harvey]
MFAEHLVSAHGVRHLLLTSRRGPQPTVPPICSSGSPI